jgi:hypothetical protein
MKHHQLINNKTNNMMQQQQILLPTIKRLNKTLIKTCAKLICISLLLTTQTAHADFRKGLTAYQNRDGKTMLAEVQDALDKKNDDGLILFMSCLKLDNVLSISSLYVGTKENPKIFVSETQTSIPKSVLETIITEKEKTTLLNNLEHSSKQSTKDAQYEYLLLRYGDLYPDFLQILPPKVRQKVIDDGQGFFASRDELIEEMALLAKNGYGKAAYFLYYVHNQENFKKYYSLEKSNYWLEIAKKNGYELEYREELKSDLPKTNKKIKNQPIISVYRFEKYFTNFSQTNYFLDIYENGDVNFYRGILIDIPANKNSIIKKLKKTEVNQIVTSIQKLSFQHQASITSNVKYTADIDVAGQSFGGLGIRRTYYLTLRKNNTPRTLVYKIAEEEKEVPIFLAKMLNIFETKVPTQLYRCGVKTERDYYQHCVNQDLKNSNH